MKRGRSVFKVKKISAIIPDRRRRTHQKSTTPADFLICVSFSTRETIFFIIIIWNIDRPTLRPPEGHLHRDPVSRSTLFLSNAAPISKGQIFHSFSLPHKTVSNVRHNSLSPIRSMSWQHNRLSRRYSQVVNISFALDHNNSFPPRISIFTRQIHQLRNWKVVCEDNNLSIAFMRSSASSNRR